MCRPKPGNRCSGCATKALTAAKNRLDKATSLFQETDAAGGFDMAPAKRRRAEQRVADSQLNMLHATLDYDASPAGMGELRKSLQALDDTDPKTKKAHDRLTRRLEGAQALRDDRARLVAAMPTAKAATPQASAARSRLGRAYAALSLATARSRAATGPNSDAEQAVVKARREAFSADVAYRFAQSEGTPDPAHLSATEVQAMRRATPDSQRAVSAMSHMRAAVAAGHHQDAPTGELEVLERRVHNDLGLNEPAPAERDDPARTTREGNPQGRARATSKGKQGVFQSGSRGSRRSGRILDKVENAIGDELDAQPGRQQSGTPILPGPV